MEPKPNLTKMIQKFTHGRIKNFEAQSEIQFHVADSLMYLISNQGTAKEMWECLREQYEKTDTIHAIALFQQLTPFHMQEGASNP